MTCVALAVGGLILLPSSPPPSANGSWIQIDGPAVTRPFKGYWFGFVNKSLVYSTIEYGDFYFPYTNYCQTTFASGLGGSAPWTEPFSAIYSKSDVYPFSVNSSTPTATRKDYYLTYSYVAAASQSVVNPNVWYYSEPAYEGWQYEVFSDAGNEVVTTLERVAQKKWGFGVTIDSYPIVVIPPGGGTLDV